MHLNKMSPLKLSKESLLSMNGGGGMAISNQINGYFCRGKHRNNFSLLSNNCTCIGFVDVDTISRLAQATILRANVQAGVPTLAGDSAISAHVSTFIVLVVEVVTGI